MQYKLTTGLARIIPIAIAAFGLASSSAFAGTIISVGLNGKSFGDGQSLHVESTGVLDASKAYKLKVEGTIKGTGDLSILTGLTLAQLAEQLETGASKYLTKVKDNPSGQLPVSNLSNQVYEGNVGPYAFSMTLSSQITAAGKLVFDINNVSVTKNSVPVVGEVVLGTGSKLTVTVAPEMRFSVLGQNVRENATSVKVKVLRFGYVGAKATVDYNMTNDTAIGGVDYVKSTDSVSFGPSQTQKIIDIPIIDNQVKKQGTRSFKVTLSNPSKGAAVGNIPETTVNILEND